MTRVRTGLRQARPLFDAMTVPKLRVISLGAGVQSTTLLLLANHGELPGGPVDYAIFADTGWEPPAVYEHLSRLEQVSEIPIIRVSKGNLRDDALDPTRRFATMPVFVWNEHSGEGQVRRQCTHEYKITAINRKLRELLGVGPRSRIPAGTVESLLGISLDEVARMKPSREQWVTIRWPLIDKRMTRHDCVLWLERQGYSIPPKSSCIGCPFHGNAYWREMRDQRPAEWTDACEFDDALRTMPPRRGERGEIAKRRYLHRSRRPLREVDLSTLADHGQGDLFDQECSGVCGV
jgi:hypothetical protein